MRVVVLVPRRADHGHRDRVWGWLYPRLADEWPVFEGHHDEGPFNRSAAINTAARMAGDWDVAIINDADCLVSYEQLHDAAVSAATGPLTLAFDRYAYLSESGTHLLLDGHTNDLESLVEWSLTDDLGASPCAVSREVWEAVGGFDERFVGWGHEDNGFRIACDALAGQVRVPGSLYHVWHPEGEREKSPTFPANCALYLEYEAARANGTMAELLEAR